MNNIYVLDKNYKKIGTLSNQGANPQAPYYEDLYVQELETGADTYQFSTMSTPYTQDLLEIGNHIMFTYKNRNELFTITSIEYSHNEGYKTIGVYAEGIGFDLLEIYMKRPENEKESSSSSGGGNDSDNDGDDNTDDEYADVDDVYIDENGNIIYDKYGQDDYADPDNVSIDGNGNIIYRRSKNNRKNDSLEFKNISYSRFLSILLKKTGWSYVCQPGLESVKHDITVRYDTNIYALLQDSMQSYRGVELEFVHELVGGKVQKVIKAYKDGGRGSFVGKRFEYGTNVRGITKTQEVANSEDDTVLYVDNVGIDVRYDVDFALKSAEVPEIEIGDTHYVIDNDFCPPMQIKARIGKIEVSFSDPTVNKIYLANNKRISGSAIEDEFDADDIKDIIDDYDYGSSGGNSDDSPTYDHYHDRLEAWCSTPSGEGLAKYRTVLEDRALSPGYAKGLSLGSEYKPWLSFYTHYIKNFGNTSGISYYGYNYEVYYDREDMENVKEITNSSEITKQDLLDFIINDLNIYEYSAIEVNELGNEGLWGDHEKFKEIRYFGLLSEDIVNHGSTCTTSEVGRRIGKGLVTDDTDGDGMADADDGHNRHVYNIPALLTALIGAFQHYVSGNNPNPPSSDPDDPDNPSNPGGGTITDGFDIVSGNELFVNKIDAVAIDVTDIYVDRILRAKDIVAASIYNMKTADIGVIDTGTLSVGVVAKIKEIEFPDGSTLTTANGFGGGSTPSNPGTGDSPINSERFTGYVVPDVSDFEVEEGPFLKMRGNPITGSNDSGTGFIGMEVQVLNISTGSATGWQDSTLYYGTHGTLVDFTLAPSRLGGFANLGTADDDLMGQWYKIYSHSAPIISSDKKYKDNIIYLDELLETQTYSSTGEVETPFLDFIKNDFKPALYNYNLKETLEQDDHQLGFIANDIIDTEVGQTFLYDYGKDGESDIKFSTNGYTTAIARALQEEVRIRDEQIANLEARLAKIEAMLGINNDN